MTQPTTEPAYSKAVIETLTVANEYCLFIEKIENFPTEELFPFLQKIITLLYLKGCLLPEIVVESDEANERFMTAEQWELIFGELRKKLANNDEFWSLDLDGPDETTPIKASISEQLTDVYQDLKDFVLLYQKNTKAAKQNAAANCKALFNSHWGIRIIDVLKFIHSQNIQTSSQQDYLDFI